MVTRSVRGKEPAVLEKAHHIVMKLRLHAPRIADGRSSTHFSESAWSMQIIDESSADRPVNILEATF